jgi:hypothetical protein
MTSSESVRKMSIMIEPPPSNPYTHFSSLFNKIVMMLRERMVTCADRELHAVASSTTSDVACRWICQQSLCRLRLEPDAHLPLSQNVSSSWWYKMAFVEVRYDDVDRSELVLNKSWFLLDTVIRLQNPQIHWQDARLADSQDGLCSMEL